MADKESLARTLINTLREGDDWTPSTTAFGRAKFWEVTFTTKLTTRQTAALNDIMIMAYQGRVKSGKARIHVDTEEHARQMMDGFLERANVQAEYTIKQT